MKHTIEDDGNNSNKRLRSRYILSSNTIRQRANRSSYEHDYNDVISVLVGQKEQPFTVHKDLMCAKSKFFAAACSERWMDGKSKVVRLPESEAQVFQIYMAWLFTGNAAVEGIKNTITEDEFSDANEQHTLIELYLLAQYLDDIKLRNQRVSVLIKRSLVWKTMPYLTDLKVVWDSTTPGCLLRKMFVDKAVSALSRNHTVEGMTAYPAGLIVELAVALMQRIPTIGKDAFSLTSAKYMEAEVSTE